MKFMRPVVTSTSLLLGSGGSRFRTTTAFVVSRHGGVGGGTTTTFTRRRWLSSSADNNDNNNDNNNNNDRLFPEDLNIIYDSKCNVCKLEIDFLQRRDARVNTGQRRLRFTDLEGETGSYNATDPANGGIDYATGMASMHGVTADGRVYTGVPVFRHAYRAVGLGWLFTITTWPVVSWIVDRLYNVFAKYRTRLTRGATLKRLVQDYEAQRSMQQQQQQSTACDSGRCQVKKEA